MSLAEPSVRSRAVAQVRPVAAAWRGPDARQPSHYPIRPPHVWPVASNIRHLVPVRQHCGLWMVYLRGGGG